MHEPGRVALRSSSQFFFEVEVEATGWRKQTHAREVVGNHTQASSAGQVVSPAGRLIAVHVGNKGVNAVAAQGAFNVLCTGACFIQ